MHLNSRAENTPLSLNFMGRKLRNHTVAPAAKQRAWEGTGPSRCAVENRGGLSRVVRKQPLVCVQNELPGSIQELREEVRHQPCNVHNTHLDQENNAGVWKRGGASWLRKSRIKWKSFKRWMSLEHCTEQSKAPAKDLNAASLNTRVREREDDVPADMKIFIPYDSAKLCITQIADDMVAMKSKHLEMVQELEENFLIASRENQERTVDKIRTYYQNKLNALKMVLDLYQEKVERRSALWEEKIKSLRSINERLQDEQIALHERNRHNSATWEREKSRMMELFSSRLDQLHHHQTSTLQELQMARMEMGRVQEMLQTSKDAKESEAKETESSDSTAHLDGAEARLEELRESLCKRQHEISMLIDGGGGVQDSVVPSAYTRLLGAVVHQAHQVYAEVTEAKQQFDQMAEENRKAVAEASVGAKYFQDNQTVVDSIEPRSLGMNPSEICLGDQVTQAEVNRQKHEVLLVAVECIKAGITPTLTGPVSQDDLAELDEHVKSFEERFKNSGDLNSEVGKRVGQQLLLLQAELKQVKEENKKMTEHYAAERTLRKKYYNMVEDMKGKIRVFCRIRPQTRAELLRGSTTIVSCLDDYSVILESPRGPREFQFDRIFTTEHTQDDVFQESSRLIQSAIDGFNVCIFAYGQTGSGKTFTMLGDREQKYPGIIPRTFNRIFEIIQENETKFEFKVSASMLELYNDRLQDLFVSPAEALSKRIEIKKDKKGLVFAQGAEAKEATSAGELFALFELGSANRHIAATKMNIESSRSHLIISIMLESRNLANGSMTYGKLNLVDLAGSERAAKTGAKDDQLKEANSINKSLSALGDVISALAMEQAHVPYRNNKLTQLMQDSLGGNAKTLMFLNVSPSDCNLDETLTSLIYASRVKAITNHAQRNMESKEITQLKEVILRLKSGQTVEEEDV
ncbi:kinesin-like protein KIN-14I [Tachysurus ichikawai]